MLNIMDIQNIIPQRSPFLLIDRIMELEPGNRAIGRKCVSNNESYFTGHFPEEPVMPGVLIIEALAQVGAVMCLSLVSNKGKNALLGGINKARFRNKIIPGDVLSLEVEIIKQLGNVSITNAKAYDEDKIYAEAELIFVVE